MSPPPAQPVPASGVTPRSNFGPPELELELELEFELESLTGLPVSAELLLLPLLPALSLAEPSLVGVVAEPPLVRVMPIWVIELASVLSLADARPESPHARREGEASKASMGRRRAITSRFSQTHSRLASPRTENLGVKIAGT